MHDPLTVAWEIKRPWPERGPGFGGHRYYPAIVTVWHLDPEKDGTDDSCDWFGRKRKGFRIHPRWHFWHYRIQIIPLQNFKRWAFSRCEECGGRFKWGEAVYSAGWDSTGPLWFRSEKGVHHDHMADRLAKHAEEPKP